MTIPVRSNTTRGPITTSPSAGSQRSRRRTVTGAITAGAAAMLLLAGCIPGGPPTPEQVADEFVQPIEPTWQVDIDGIYGEPVVRDGLVFTYAADDEVGLRLEVRSLENGELVWEHTASPGGAHGNPILGSVNAASRTYPYPAIRPIVMERGEGEDAQLVVVFFEREVADDGTLVPDDYLRVADAATGDLLEVTFEPYDEYEYRPYGTTDDGDVFLNSRDPGRPCGAGRICFLGDGDDFSATARVALDVESLVLEYTPVAFLEEEHTLIPDWGTDFALILTDEASLLGKFEDGALLWQADFDDLFAQPGTSAPDYVDFAEVGGLVLIQGYQPIVETLDPDLPHTLDIDHAASRTLIAIEPETGEVVWRAPGADMLCHAVRERTIQDDDATIPVCNVTGGSFVFDLSAEGFIEQTDIVASIAELNVSDGSFGWEVEGAGENSIAHVTRLGDSTFASRGDLAVTSSFDALVEDAEDANADVQLVNLVTGEAIPAAEDATFVCKVERPDVELEFEGSTFSGGANPITTGYPAGWHHFPCGPEGAKLEGDDAGWTKGGVRIAGYPGEAGDKDFVVLPIEGGLVAFALG